MVEGTGTKKNVPKRARKLVYFYLNGNLHRSLHKDRSADVITTWCYPEHRRVAYTYSDVRRRMEPAFSSKEVCSMINRSRVVVEKVLLDGMIEQPQFTYGLDENKKKYKYMWHENDIMALHAYFLTVHFGRPRKDGIVRPKAMPSARELRALIRQQPLMGYLDADGKFTPTWLAQDL